MATRREVNQQKLAMSYALRTRCRLGQLMPGEPVPSLRQLSEEFSISTRVVNEVLQDLITEGLFHRVPRVGTFVGRPKVLNTEFYLMLRPDEYTMTTLEDLMPIQHGFEEGIAEKGGASIAVSFNKALELRASGELPPIVGVFDMAYDPRATVHWGNTGQLPRVGFAGRIEEGVESDEISYDDEGGGRLAASHLLELGHRNIAFLALHRATSDTGRMDDVLIWSHEREAGWRQALNSYGVSAEGLAFHPTTVLGSLEPEQAHVGSELGRQILARPEITAVVAANDFAAQGFLNALRTSGLPASIWPSIVGFDNLSTANGHVLTSLRLPGEQLGRAAADLLWERRHGQLGASPVHRRVAMRLIPRLTSRRDGVQSVSEAMLATA